MYYTLTKSKTSSSRRTDDCTHSSYGDMLEQTSVSFNSGYGFDLNPKPSSTRNPGNSLSLVKSQSIFEFHSKPATPGFRKSDWGVGVSSGKTEIKLNQQPSSIRQRMARDVNDIKMITLRKNFQEQDSYLYNEVEPKTRLNSLISIMVSTIMCLAAKCPLPRSNIQATKLFLGTVVDDAGETPRNIRGLLNLLRNYDGPFDGESNKSLKSDKMKVEVVQKREEPVKTISVPIDKLMAPRCRSRMQNKSPVKKSFDNKKYSLVA